VGVAVGLAVDVGTGVETGVAVGVAIDPVQSGSCGVIAQYWFQQTRTSDSLQLAQYTLPK
jgi:hypothetical protein